MKIRVAAWVGGFALLAGSVSAQASVAQASVAQASAAATQPGADGAPPASAVQAPASAAAQSRLETDFQGPLIVHFDSGGSNVVPQDEALLDRAARLYREGHPLAMILTGGTDSVVPTPPGTAQPENRRVEIRWR